MNKDDSNVLEDKSVKKIMIQKENQVIQNLNVNCSLQEDSIVLENKVQKPENKCYQCKKAKKFQMLDVCKCGIVYCIKHRFHDCIVKKSEKIKLPEKVEFSKINKI